MTQETLPTIEPAQPTERPTSDDIVLLVAERYSVSPDVAGKWLRDAFETLPF